MVKMKSKVRKRDDYFKKNFEISQDKKRDFEENIDVEDNVNIEFSLLLNDLILNIFSINILRQQVENLTPDKKVVEYFDFIDSFLYDILMRDVYPKAPFKDMGSEQKRLILSLFHDILKDYELDYFEYKGIMEEFERNYQDILINFVIGFDSYQSNWERTKNDDFIETEIYSFDDLLDRVRTEDNIYDYFDQMEKLVNISTEWLQNKSEYMREDHFNEFKRRVDLEKDRLDKLINVNASRRELTLNLSKAYGISLTTTYKELVELVMALDAGNYLIADNIDRAISGFAAFFGFEIKNIRKTRNDVENLYKERNIDPNKKVFLETLLIKMKKKKKVSFNTI
jgi:hypothetical protein